MRNSKILAKIRAGQPARLAMMGHFIPPFVAYAAHCGYDGIWIDNEHRAFDGREMQALLALCHLYDIDGLVRPATRDKAPLYRYLEDGAVGLLVPHVSTPEEAEDLVRKVKFPPVGDRGVHGGGLEANYGLDTAGGRDALVQHALRETMLVIQVETPLAVSNVDALAAVPGVDGLYIGPADLGIRMALESEPQPYDETMKVVAEACQKYGKFWGTLPRSLAELEQQQALGAQLLAWGQDSIMILEGLRRYSADLDTVS
ncbi:MAG: 4-hydroxy-2-oxovalerate aldolase [Anaerolineae bacterium]|nr:4-hydroxy-2-oxovalerate aldolase [Anaerolineae bacterium]